MFVRYVGFWATVTFVISLYLVLYFLYTIIYLFTYYFFVKYEFFTAEYLVSKHSHLVQNKTKLYFHNPNESTP